MQLAEVRQRYIEFFKKRGHAVLPSASLVPENDPTTLFTGSGMQPLVPYLLGKNHPVGTRLVNSQKCFRAMDIEEVGDNRHTTLFEMLGNWSLGDYFKKEQINWFWEFLTKEIGLDSQRIFVTCYIGNQKAGIPKDAESAGIWKDIFSAAGIEAKEVEIGTEEQGYEVGEQGGRIFYYADKNWWSRAGGPEKMPTGEPGGPDTEMFYLYPEIVHDQKWGKYCHPNCDCGRYIELGNSVFMEYRKVADGFENLPKKNVDYGGGLERIAAAAANMPDIFPVAHGPILSYLETVSGKKYADDERSFRVVADHMKAAVFLIAHHVRPGNTEREYFVRRLIRRSVLFADRLGVRQEIFSGVVVAIAEMYQDQYPELRQQEAEIKEFVAEEERKFRKTLEKGLKKFNEVIETFWNDEEDEKILRGDVVFDLYQTYGFPFELIKEEAERRGFVVDEVWFRNDLEKHRETSRAGSEQKFKGGLADTAEATVRLHTAHHLLLRALQLVLGEDVHQRGSNITQERLRIDFSYGQKMTEEEKIEVERIVNDKIDEALPVVRSELSLEEAERLGAEHEFGQKYPERVSVYSVGPKGATVDDPQFDKRFSLEFCGGPHVSNTSELREGGRRFKIQKEEAVAQGVRRIRAVLTVE